MDYTSKEIREKLYRERTHISDFGVDDVHNLTCYMEGAFLRLKITDMENMAECILDAFNNAYYITTAILQEKNPSAYRAQFMKIALSVRTDNEVYRTQFAVLTMTMVINILQVYDKKYQTPIEITRHFLEECIKRECEKIASIDTYLLFTQNLLDMSDEWRGVQYDRINRDDFIPLNQQSEDNRIEHEDKQSLIARIRQLEATIEDMRKPVADLSAKQKVRMELARRFMEKAGINQNVLEKQGNKDKAGELMAVMLNDITPQTCKQYISQPVLSRSYHEKTINLINPLLEELCDDIRL